MDLVTVLIATSRRWRDGSLVRRVLAALKAHHGVFTVWAARPRRRGERLAAAVARELGLVVEDLGWAVSVWARGRLHYADRNARLLGFRPDVVLAFHEAVDTDPPVKHLLDCAAQHRIPVLLYPGVA